MEFSTPLPTTTSITDGLENQTEAGASASPAGGSEGCFIEPQLAFIVVASSGSLMLVLLISVVLLACKVLALKRQGLARRPNRNNTDARGSSNWSAERAEGGIVGPCETNLLLEDVLPNTDDAALQEEGEARLHQSKTKNQDEENVLVTMRSSTSRDSCRDPAKEREDMPLVV